MTGGKLVPLDDIVMATGETPDAGEIEEASMALADHPLHVSPNLRAKLSLESITESSQMQTRGKFDPENDPDDKRFLESVREKGVLIPIHVVLISEDPPSYRLAAGHRRVAAARLAGSKTLPAVEFPRGTSQRDLDEFTIAENAHRKALAPIELAKQVKLYQQLHAWSQRDLAIYFNISLGHANNLLALIGADQRIQRLVEEEHLSVSAAAKINKLPEDQIEEAIAAVEEGAPAGSAIELTAKTDQRNGSRQQSKKERSSPKDTPQKVFIDRTVGKEPWRELQRKIGRRKDFKALDDNEKAFLVIVCMQGGDHAATLERYTKMAVPVRKALKRTVGELVKLSAVAHRAHKKEEVKTMLTNFGLDWVISQ